MHPPQTPQQKNLILKNKTPPPPPHTYVCISIIFSFSCNHCHTFEKQKTKVIESFFWGGGVANKVYYGRCANGELENHEGGRTVMSDGVLRDAGRETRKQEKKGCDIRLCPFL